MKNWNTTDSYNTGQPMPDALETFVAQHRDELDAYEPDALLWQRIAQQLDAEAGIIKPATRRGIISIVPPRHVLWRAAATVLVFVSVFLALRQYTLPSQPATLQPVNLASISPELAEADAFYTTQIKARQQEIQTLAVATHNPALKAACQQDFVRDLAHLDSMYTVLKQELATAPTDERVANALVENLQLRIEILNQQLQIVQKYAKRPGATDNKQQTNQYENNAQSL